MKRLPSWLKGYFWDVEFEKVDVAKDRVFILKRILEYGNEKAVRWVWGNFKVAEVKNALCNFRGYSLKSANFWAVILGIKKNKVKCLSRPFREIQRQLWPY